MVEVGTSGEELGYAVKEKSKQIKKGIPWFLMAAHKKMGEERDKLMGELLNKKEAG